MTPQGRRLKPGATHTAACKLGSTRKAGMPSPSPASLIPDAGKSGKRKRGKLRAILLDARGAQAGQAMLIDRVLPGKKFFDREGVAAAGLFEG